ncbi:hypothetical protein [Flexivirga meconopsidis]|uniref:hypothetical protein n=1 Tax=Flexivirga meconopsidis TaxID=2977121 RepID=UPI0022405BDB|nr:hypothetical protein [Flexivirga meconopsidis]
MTQIDSQISSTAIYTMRELNHETPRVIREINESGRPAAITRRGRFVALITPLADAGVESAALSKALEAAPDRAQLLGEQTAQKILSAAQVADELDITLPER